MPEQLPLDTFIINDDKNPYIKLDGHWYFTFEFVFPRKKGSQRLKKLEYGATYKETQPGEWKIDILNRFERRIVDGKLTNIVQPMSPSAINNQLCRRTGRGLHEVFAAMRRRHPRSNN